MGCVPLNLPHHIPPVILLSVTLSRFRPSRPFCILSSTPYLPCGNVGVVVAPCSVHLPCGLPLDLCLRLFSLVFQGGCPPCFWGISTPFPPPQVPIFVLWAFSSRVHLPHSLSFKFRGCSVPLGFRLSPVFRAPFYCLYVLASPKPSLSGLALQPGLS